MQRKLYALNSYQSVEKMLEDVRILLHLSAGELASALSLLEKVSYGNLVFDSGDVIVRFEGFRPAEDSILKNVRNRVIVEVEAVENEVKRTVQYVIPSSALRVLEIPKKVNVQNLVKKEKSESYNFGPCYSCGKTQVQDGKYCPSCKINVCYACRLQLKYLNKKDPDFCPNCGRKLV
ncbi:MAG: zinc ribbon domain-containing protein [Candidatus Bathyarchaeia archaeon]|jgi:hypothetical protein